MAQKYKVYFANRPVMFGGRDSGVQAMRCKIIRSQGKADTMLIESAIAGGAREVNLCCEDVDASWKVFCEQFDHVPAAGGVVRNREGRLLFIFRHGKWDLPKGKIEDNEEVEAGALREVEEECSIHGARIIHPLITTWHTYIQDGVPTLKSTAWYVMEYGGNKLPKPQLEEGITEVRWFDPAELSEIRSNTYPSIIDVIDAYLAHEA